MDTITKEDLLFKLSKLRAEHSLLKSKVVEFGKMQSYISELEDTLSNLKKENQRLNNKIGQLIIKHRDKNEIEAIKLAKIEILRDKVIQDFKDEYNLKISKLNEKISNMRKTHEEVLSKYLEYKRLFD